MKLSLKPIIASCLLIMAAQSSFALNIIPSDSGNYYELGGGSDITMPPVTRNEDITIGANANSNLGYDCDGFNPAVSIANEFNNMKNSIEGLSQSVIGSATSAIGSLPMMALEKADPELYNLIQNTILHGMDTFDVSMKDCQQALSQISKGQDPYQKWFSVSDSQGWMQYSKAASQGQSVDINQAKSTIAANRSSYGVPWMTPGQNSGGKNQVPIHVISDVIVAGYNALISSSRPLNSTEPAPSTSTFYTYWKTPQAAGTWGTMVLGDITISSDAPETTQAGIGLTTLMQLCPSNATNALTCTKTLGSALATIVSSNTVPTSTQLASVSSQGLMITPEVINAIRNMTPQEQAIAVGKVASDVSLQNTINEALLLRRMLIAGTFTKPVQTNKSALTTVKNTIARLDKDIQSLMFEVNVRKQLGTDTLSTLLNMGTGQAQTALESSVGTQLPNSEHGANYTTAP